MKWQVLAVIAVVALGVAFSGCGKKADPKAAQELCKLTGEAAGVVAKEENPTATDEAIKDLVDQGVEQCLSQIENVSDEDKSAAYKQAGELLAKCKGKTGREFGSCVGAM